MSDPGPEVSIITIGHSVRHELERFLPAVEEHAGVPFEVIYADNASTDDTLAWLRENHPEVTVIELQENVWDGARNPALRRARGRYTMFLDSDALLTPNALPIMVEAMDEHPQWGLIGPRLTYPDGTLQLSCRRFPPRLLPLMRRPPLSRLLGDSRPVRSHLMADVDPTQTRPVLYMISACLLFRTELARQIGPLDEAIGLGGTADVDWGLRWSTAGMSGIYFPGATVIHDYRRTSSKSPLSRGAWRHLKAFVRLQWKYRRQRRSLIRLADQLDRSVSS
jgi:GT2 family glycosyltransferase